MSILKELLTVSNIGFSILMVGLAIIALRKINNAPRKSIVIPGIIAAIGIIGTFWGIFRGLIVFDPKDLEGSVPNLINGMRTAFFTSLLGLILSNILKGWQAHKINKLNELNEKEEDVSLERIAELMNEMRNSMVSSNKELVENIKLMNEGQEVTQKKNEESMDRMVKALVGDSETSMTTQMKLLRTDLVDSQREAQKLLNDGLDKMVEQLGSLVSSNNAISEEIEKGNKELITEFRNFAEDMAENNMKAFIDAIERSIKDLNTQLKEQFGENFKQLNLAVEKLLEWQEHYKETVEKTNLTQQELYKGIEEARMLVTTIMENTKPIVDVANRLGDKIVTFDTQEQNLNSSIEILNKISGEAKEMLPNLDSYISNYHKTTEKSIKETEDSLKTMHLNIENSIVSSNEKITENTIDATNQITKHVVETTKKGIEEVNKSSENVLKAVAKVHEKATEEISDLSSVVDKKVEETINKVSELTINLIKDSDKLFNSIEETTNSIQKQFTQTFSKLDETREEILNLTKVSTENLKKQQLEIVEAIEKVTISIKENTAVSIDSINNEIAAIESAIAKLESEGLGITNKISDNIQKMIEQNNNNLETSVKNLNTSLEATLNTSLESLGNQLALVSQKFVSDYTPLTEKLKDVIELSKGLR